jgi:hypothetical protein
MPKESFSHSSITPVTRDIAWRSLDLPATWEGIGGVDRIIDPVLDDHGRLHGFTFLTTIGGRSYRGTARANQRIEGRSMGWAISSSEVKGAITVELHDHEGGTLVDATIDLESVGVLSTMFFPVIAGALRSGMAGTVERFASGLGEPDM